MSAFYERMRGTGDRLVSKYGVAGALVSRAAPGAPNDGAPWEPNAGGAPEPPARFPCKILRTAYALRDVDGVRVLRGDARLVVSSPVAPSVGDALEFGGEVYQVINPTVVSPAGVDVIYIVQARR